jgi:16S rRNA (guanine966-N2)-methyltransferase
MPRQRDKQTSIATTTTTTARQAPGSVRVIGGTWRGRRLSVVPGAPIRPTPDRVRETVFNWLQPVIPGAHCLDLFAGTGALGVEALSRGAARATFVEQHRGAAEAIAGALATFGGVGDVLTMDARAYLAAKAPLSPAAAFTVVFVDPPFAAADYPALCTLLAAGWLAPAAMVYLEMPREQQLPKALPGYTVHREATAGDVRYGLLRWH